MYDFKKTKLENKAKLLTHKYFKKGQRQLLRLIKRRKKNHRKSAQEAQADWSAIFGSFLSSDVEGEGGKLGSKYGIMVNFIQKSSDSTLKNGVSNVLELLTKFISQGERSLSQKEKIKLQLCKNMFQMFEIIDSDLEEKPRRNARREKIQSLVVEDCCTDQSDVEEIDLLGKRPSEKFDGFKRIRARGTRCGEFEQGVGKVRTDDMKGEFTG